MVTKRQEYMKKRYERHRARAIRYLGGKCVVCGTVENLEFDHKVPELKARDISKLLTHAWDTIEAELDKCQLLCVDHHKEKTRNEVIPSKLQRQQASYLDRLEKEYYEKWDGY